MWEAGLFGGWLLAFLAPGSDIGSMSVSFPIGDPPVSHDFSSQGCVYPMQQQQWVPPQTVETTVTEVCEYDEEGRMVRKTTTTTTKTQGGYYLTTNTPWIQY